ncbi:MAG: nucleoside hydrolase [Streptosporangiales bacterium]|nr:nucleoside hydrolase [Streptosporangiales bacterium]
MRIILDCDPGVDDALAIFYLAQQHAEVVAAGTVHGNTTAEQAAVNTLRLFEMCGLDDVPVAAGARVPLAQPLHVAANVHGDDGLGDVGVQEPAGGPTGESAAEQLVRLARAAPGAYDLLAIGPLTNVAVATLLEPELPRLLRSVVVMGGAVEVPGNITPHAEANIWHDPEAADLVLGAGYDLTLIGLDVTMRAMARADWLDAVAASERPQARFTTRILGFYVDYYESWLGFRACAMHDPLAAAVLLDPALATCRETPVRVELRGEHTRGSTVADLRPGKPGDPDDRPPVKVVLEAAVPEFLDRLRTSIAG